jgi:hypothetical protein
VRNRERRKESQMLHLYETKKVKRVAIVAALLTLTTAGVAVARQEPQFPGLPPANGNNGGGTGGNTNITMTNGQALQPILQRATQFQQAAIARGNSGPTAVRVSYSAANQAFGDLLRAIGGKVPTTGIAASSSDRTLNLSSEQAANDVRFLKSAARQAKSADEENRLKKAASLYATGAKEFLTAQLREALLESDVAAPVVVRGNASEADAATRAQNQPPPAPAPAPQKPAPNPNPNPAPAPNPAPVPNPNPAPNPAPVPNPAPNPAPVPNPAPAPNPQPDPNPAPAPQPADPNNPPAPQNPPGS